MGKNLQRILRILVHGGIQRSTDFKGGDLGANHGYFHEEKGHELQRTPGIRDSKARYTRSADPEGTIQAVLLVSTEALSSSDRWTPKWV